MRQRIRITVEVECASEASMSETVKAAIPGMLGEIVDRVERKLPATAALGAFEKQEISTMPKSGFAFFRVDPNPDDRDWKEIALYLADCHSASLGYEGALKSVSKSRKDRLRSICQTALDLIQGASTTARKREEADVIKRLADDLADPTLKV